MVAVWTSSGGRQGIVALGRVISSAFHFGKVTQGGSMEDGFVEGYTKGRRILQ